MNVKKYIANSPQEAMELIRKEKGGEAVILSTKTIRQKGIRGYFSRPMVEFVVAFNENNSSSLKNTGDIENDKSFINGKNFLEKFINEHSKNKSEYDESGVTDEGQDADVFNNFLNSFRQKQNQSTCSENNGDDFESDERLFKDGKVIKFNTNLADIKRQCSKNPEIYKTKVKKSSDYEENKSDKQNEKRITKNKRGRAAKNKEDEKIEKITAAEKDVVKPSARTKKSKIVKSEQVQPKSETPQPQSLKKKQTKVNSEVSSESETVLEAHKSMLTAKTENQESLKMSKQDKQTVSEELMGSKVGRDENYLYDSFETKSNFIKSQLENISNDIEFLSSALKKDKEKRNDVFSCDHEKVNSEYEKFGDGISLGSILNLQSDIMSKVCEMEQKINNVGYLVNGIYSHIDTLGISDNLREIYEFLIQKGISRELALSICTDENVKNSSDVKLAVKNFLLNSFLQIEKLKTTKGKCTVVLFLGSRGSGKSSSMLKLAADERKKNGKNICLSTTDIYKIGEFESLSAYSKILNLDLYVKEQDEILSVVREAKGNDYLFIDTPGRSGKNNKYNVDIQKIISLSKPHYIYLVLNSTLSMDNMKEIAENYKKIKNYQIILTKIDETVNKNIIFDVVNIFNRPVAYVSDSENILDGMKILDYCNLINQLFHE